MGDVHLPSVFAQQRLIAAKWTYSSRSTNGRGSAMTILRLNAWVPSRGRGSCTVPTEKIMPTVTSGARALAHYIEDALEAGRFASAAEVTESLGVTRARVSQVMALLGLAPGVQEQVLMREVVMSGRGLRVRSGCPAWATQ